MNRHDLKAVLADTKEKLVVWAVIAILCLVSENILNYSFIPFILIAIFVYWLYLFITFVYLTILEMKK
ncbi:hypothetical protein [Pediococcus ethanolidurans]|uniref:Uncharacterized protein n=1 Tax=Pediococcus ethanolidurans TaxID=319653 RepID=A0A0R2K3R9_9LACO|nr:hypothetical protein [Pediococcus ethanolidurans]KRN81788.1 hypothetical protein IV87_GL000736 [Pediococcus ethanolidurans]MBU7562632.1 hypothetical protein [Pediococcus ethanolidurans]MCT4398311.1 hypothetical protein [Pediococcus ethanolidurans]MCV3315694.1 hypothetical protein [Pediococcus ethanolidurans]SER81366.1 hypothetical protein SAMN04487973_11846 [Pediococcus ethanolidurans]